MNQRETWLDRLTGGATGPGDDPRAAQFVRGLALGALVGAAIAGSTLLQRRHARREGDKTVAPAPEVTRAPGPEKD